MSAPKQKPLDAFAVRIASVAVLVEGLARVYHDDERTRVHLEPVIEKIVDALEAGGVLDLFDTCRECLLPHGAVVLVVSPSPESEPSTPTACGKN